jgi:hypothetical protein
MRKKKNFKLAWLGALLIVFVGLFLFAAFRENKNHYLEILAEVSLFVAASIATHFLYHVLQEEEHVSDIRDAINQTEDRILNGVVGASNRLGLAGFEKKLDYGELLDSLEETDELLWLDTFAQSYTVFMDRLNPAIERGCRIRMLVIDPHCENVKHRAAEIGGSMFADPERFRQQVENFLSTTKSMAAQATTKSGSIEVRRYSSLPCVPLYIVRRAELPIRGYSSFFFHRATDGYFHIRWRDAKEGFLHEASEYFERKWKANEMNVEFAFNVKPAS